MSLSPLLCGLKENASLGILGGGQLARMWAHAAQAMGFRTVVLDPDPQAPAASICHDFIQGAYDDPLALDQLIARSDVVSTEFENVPASSLSYLARHRPVFPDANAVSIAQDRLKEKTFFAQACKSMGIGPAPYVYIEKESDITAISADYFPAILKTSTLGYDGKGQIKIEHPSQLLAAWESLKKGPCVLEKQLDLLKECSVIVARNALGQCVHLPLQTNLHVKGILAKTEVYPESVSEPWAQQAIQAACLIAEQLHYVGVLCVEFFLIQNAQGEPQWVVNEMAPRPHNSGHYSIDACDLSQFELQVRTMAHLPLYAPRLHSAAVMLNVLGDIWPSSPQQGELACPPWHKVCALPGVHLHLYDKKQARIGRKMGHITITAADIEQARQSAKKVQSILGLPLV